MIVAYTLTLSADLFIMVSLSTNLAQNAPFSAVVCGVQGSGKSHTISVLLESMLVPKCTRIGRLDKPLAGLVLHFGEGGASAQPCEAAWIGASQDLSLQLPSVKVFVAQSSLKTMTKVYSALGPSVEVEPLLFTEHELDAEAFLAMMSVGSSDGAPLYIQRVLVSLVFFTMRQESIMYAS